MGLRYEIEYSFFNGKEVRRKSVSSARLALAVMREYCLHIAELPEKLEANPVHKIEWTKYGKGYVTVTDTQYKPNTH